MGTGGVGPHSSHCIVFLDWQQHHSSGLCYYVDEGVKFPLKTTITYWRQKLGTKIVWKYFLVFYIIAGLQNCLLCF